MTNGTTPTENGVADAAILAAIETNETVASSEITAPEPKPASFDDLGLHPDVKQALDDMGYFSPTPVQTAVFKPVTEGKDLLVQSRTGTGKTTAFGLPIINRLLPTVREPQALILAPTRELALQVSRELTLIGKTRGIIVEAIYGGAPIGKQIANLRDGVHIVVGTPGRVLDHIGRRTLDLKTVQTFVLDECDEMLSMGFLEDIEKIASHLPEKRQTLLFSATMPEEVLRYSRRQMKSPEQLSLSRDSVSVEEIHHAYYIVSGIARSRDLLKILFAENPESAIIFCNTRDETTMVAKFLTKQGLDAEPLSSDLSQSDRERVMGRMKQHNLRFLCATDVAARGIDITNLSHVINYSVPEAPEVYVHRTGRTGRAGKKGTALSLVGPRELGSFRYVRLTFGIKPEERILPKDDIFIGKLKVPLPPIGVPQPPDPVQILLRGVTGTPTDLERAIFEKVLAKSDGKRVLAQLLAEKLNLLSTRTTPKPVRRERPEGEERAAGEERGERPRFGEDRGERPRFGEDRGERGGRDRGRDRDRPRFGEDRGPRMEGRDRYERDRGPRPGTETGEQAVVAAPIIGEGTERTERPDRGERGDRPRFDRERGDRPRFDREARGGEDRPRRDRDERPREDRPRDERPREDRPRFEARGEDRPREDRGPREDRAPREDRPREDRPRHDREARGEGGERRERHEYRERAPEVAPVQDATAVAEVVEVTTTTTAEAAPPIRAERHEGRRGRERHDTEPEMPRPVAMADATIETQPTKVDDVARAVIDRAEKGKRTKPRSEPTEATREFWETWADNKSTREPVVAEAAAEEPTEERKPSRDRGRGDKKPSRDRDKGRDKRDTKLEISEPKAETTGRKRADTAPVAAGDANQARLFVSLGKKHGVSADDLRSLLAGPIGGDKARIGSVSLRDSHAHVRVPEELVDAIIAGVHGTQHNDQSVTVERSRA